MRRVKLDRIDRHILRDLQDDGRMTNVELASRAGISAPPCLRPEMLGYSVTIYAHVGLTSQAETDLAKFEQMVGEWPEVRECHMLMGEADFLLKIVARDWDAFQKFLTSRLTPAPLVSNVKTALVIRTRKRLPGVPIDEEPEDEDEQPAA